MMILAMMMVIMMVVMMMMMVIMMMVMMMVVPAGPGDWQLVVGNMCGHVPTPHMVRGSGSAGAVNHAPEICQTRGQ